MPEKLWREATIDDANPQQMWVVPVEPETLYRLNVNTGPGGGQCVCCGGSVQAVLAVPVEAAGIGGDDAPE